MRPDRTLPASRDAFDELIDEYRDRIEGRLGIFLGRPKPNGFDIVYTVRPDERFTSASMIKVPVLWTLYDCYDGCLDDLTTPNGIAEANRVDGSGVFHLLADLNPSLEDLARAMIAISDNTATNELIDHLGCETVTERMHELGLTETRLGRKMMVTDEGEGDLPPDALENLISPRDVAMLFADIHRGETLSRRAYERLRVPLRHQKDTSMFARYRPLDHRMEHKTGWLSTAALDAGVCHAGNDPLVYAVFLDGMDHGGDGTDVIAEIGDAVHTWLRSQE
ncbi:serine hydrolase [Halococcus agarilyticus]|uniref:serine hydrolase n=1 Tax=Halococcus agarilyticus TaxID=1232219 RepID=UPI0009AC2516|nr:serine hydrolase [Halococcus agarilyticus]